MCILCLERVYKHVYKHVYKRVYNVNAEIKCKRLQTYAQRVYTRVYKPVYTHACRAYHKHEKTTIGNFSCGKQHAQVFVMS